MIGNNDLIMRKMSCAVFLLLMNLLFCSCVSHLQEAKLYYTQGQELSRVYSTERAIASYKKSLEEVEIEIARNPSAQAYMIKGMVEVNLKMWQKAEKSFLSAFSLGFPEGQEWAEQVSLFGLASSLEEMGLEESAFKVYSYLVSKSKLKPVTLLAAQRYTDIALRDLPQEGEKERQRSLEKLLKSIEKLSVNDLSCGYYHYLQSQVLSHKAEYGQSFEEAVMAKELGLPTEEIMRDNDLQIVFCFKNLKQNLEGQKWEKFYSMYLDWTQKWMWPDPETPDWKKR
jgi:tetratricopeptide (TPR) repeat protein